MSALGIVKNHYYEFLLLLPLLVEHIFGNFLIDHILNYKEHSLFLFFYTFLPWCQSFVVHGGYKLHIWHFFHLHHSQVHATIPRLVLHLHDDDINVRQACRVFFLITILPHFSLPEACWRFLNITYLFLYLINRVLLNECSIWWKWKDCLLCSIHIVSILITGTQYLILKWLSFK